MWLLIEFEFWVLIPKRGLASAATSTVFQNQPRELESAGQSRDETWAAQASGRTSRDKIGPPSRELNSDRR